MVPTLRVDDDVYEYIQQKAEPFTDTPNSVLRRLFGLDEATIDTGEESVERLVWLVVHSQLEFAGPEELADWIVGDLKTRKVGVYHVANRRSWQNIGAGTLCLFHKSKQIVGEGLVKTGVQPYQGGDVSPATGRPYQGVVEFDPDSLKVYAPPISFNQAEQMLGKKLTYRGNQRITWAEYERLAGLI